MAKSAAASAAKKSVSASRSAAPAPAPSGESEFAQLLKESFGASDGLEGSVVTGIVSGSKTTTW